MPEWTDTFDHGSTGEFGAGSPHATLYPRLPDGVAPPAGLPAIPLGVADPNALKEVEKLGEGGMGVIHMAQDPVLNRLVATKRPRHDAGGRAAAGLITEARTLAGLDHPNIVPIHALGIDPSGVPVVVMKRIVGLRWSDLLRQERALDRHLRVLLEVTDAVRFAHARGVLHRDLKPDNVMVGEFGEVYLMDWGCACRMEEAVTRDLVGTPAYLAPEMLERGAPIGPQTDVFLLGAVLQEVVTGAPRNAGLSLREVLDQAHVRRPPRWSEDVPAALARIIDTACAPTQAERFPSVEAFAEAIRSFLAHQLSASVAARASAALPRLEQAIVAGDARAEILFAECRLGFRTALEGWPECTEAREGIARACALYLPWKIRIGELDTAEALLPEAEPEAARRWAEDIRRVREDRRAAAAALKEMDVSFAVRERRKFVVGMFLTGLIAVAFRPPDPLPSDVVTTWHLARAVEVVVVAVAWTIPFRKRIFSNRMSRTILSSVLILLLVQVMHRALGIWSLSPVEAVLRGDVLLMGTGLAVVSVFTHPLLLLSALPYFVAAVVISTRPDLSEKIFPAALMSSGAVVAALLLAAERLRGPSSGAPKHDVHKSDSL